MKRALVLILALLIFSFSACATQPRKPVPTPLTKDIDHGALKDGTYTGTGDNWKYGNEEATVVVAEGKMAQVTLKKFTAEGQEVNYEEWAGVGSERRPNLKQFRKELAKRIIVKQSTTVDDIAGATISSKNWKISVERALEQAEVK